MLFKNQKYSFIECSQESISEELNSFDYLDSSKILKMIVEERGNYSKNNLYSKFSKNLFSKTFGFNQSYYKKVESWENFAVLGDTDFDLGSSYYFNNNISKLEKLEVLTEHRIQESKKSLDLVTNSLSEILFENKKPDCEANENLNFSFISSSELYEKIRKLSDSLSINFEDYNCQELNFDDIILHRLTQSIETYVENIRQDVLLLSYIKALFKLINGSLIKLLLNKRDFFRKINSFHFKNLDDYHSISVIA